MSAKKRAGKKKGYYEAQKLVTIRHKKDRAAKRAANLSFWLDKGVKKNGKKVLTFQERKDRAAVRGNNRRSRKAELRAQQQQERRQEDNRRYNPKGRKVHIPTVKQEEDNE